MQTLSPILVLRMQQPVLWLEQGCEPTLCSFTQSGILSSWLVKAYLKAGRGEKPGSFWNINMLRNYIATIWINTTGTPCVSTAPKVQTHTQIFSKSLIKVRHDAAPWTVSFHTCHSHGKIHITFEGRDQEGVLWSHHLWLWSLTDIYFNTFTGPTWCWVHPRQSVWMRGWEWLGSFVHYARLETESRVRFALT